MIAAIVPAAGLSRRMGRPKLILPLADGRTVLATMLSGLMLGGVERLILITPPRESPLSEMMIREAAELEATVVVPEVQPEDMRASVELGLAEILRGNVLPTTLLLCPADSPGISAGLVSRVIQRAMVEPEAIVIPTFQSKRGHPIALPWVIAKRIPSLPGGVGVNALIEQYASIVVEIIEEEAGAVLDLDTPEDYRRWNPRAEPSTAALPEPSEQSVRLNS